MQKLSHISRSDFLMLKSHRVWSESLAIPPKLDLSSPSNSFCQSCLTQAKF